MENHFELSDRAFEVAFENCQIPATLFSHEAHLRLAWIHVSKYGLAAAEKNIQQQLEQFVTFVGAKDKYHKTLTIAAIRSVAHFVGNSHANKFKDFISEFPQLNKEFRALVANHYSFDIFNSQEAKRTFIAPDLLAF